MDELALMQFNICSAFTLSNDDTATISLLYAPLLGSEATMLYFAMQALLERNNLKSEKFLHQEFFDIYGLTEKSFLKARNRLEGMGLLLVYAGDTDFIYVISPPLSPKNFIKDVTLGLYLYAKIGKELYEKISKHFKIEKIDKQNYRNVTLNFDDVFASQTTSDVSFSKFQYLLGRKPYGIRIQNYNFDFAVFLKEINQDFLETGVTPQFEKQIMNLAFVYAFDENQMASLYAESINKSGLYDYRLLKKKANVLYLYNSQLAAPKLVEKKTTEDDFDLVAFLDNSPAEKILKELRPSFPNSYLATINDIYSNIDLPRGVLNAMIIKVLKEKDELPSLQYFKKMSQTWIAANVFDTEAAIKYLEGVEIDKNAEKKTSKSKHNVGDFETL